jgi:16S rRNA (cytidine1402-2'-O)-methyltransferase
MPGTFFVVATPIGNLEDITLRALRILREVQVIAAEDTRRTARLLARHAISTPTVSFHEHNTRTRMPQLMARLQRGESVALVTDAGTPGISDPGTELVHACIEAGIAVDPIPGVSAPLAAAVASGFPLMPLTILGFPPTRSKDRSTWIETLYLINNTVTFFEAPHRIADLLRAIAPKLGDRPIMVARELTKLHQEFLHGTASQIATQLRSIPKGEFTVVVGPLTKTDQSACPPDDDRVAYEFGLLTESGAMTRREAVSATAKRLGLPARDVYAAVERAKNR